MEIQQKLNEIQQKLKAPKNQRNNFGNYNYRSCEDILEAVKPLLGEAVLTLHDDVLYVGNRYYIKSTATLSLGSEEIQNTAFAREAEIKKGMDEAQITGSVSSYARKYALNGLFCIDDTKDADTMDNSKEPVKYVKEEDDDKPWITDELFEDAISKSVSAGLINADTNPIEVMKLLRKKYKVAKKYEGMIKENIIKYSLS